MPLKNQQWIYTKRPNHTVSDSHYQLVSTNVPNIKEGEILVKSRFISVDPYMRIQQSANNTWEAPHPLNQVQGAGVIGEVIASKSAHFNVGDLVNTYTGWQEYGICTDQDARKINFPNGIPASYGISVLGMPGRTAYFGLMEIGQPKAGETLLVSGAAGAVGSIVSQIGKILEMRVVGIAGGAKKCEQLLNNFGLDGVIDYKSHSSQESMQAAILDACPNGIDVYYDNVGGYITDAVMQTINVAARIIICGQISQYNGGLDKPELGPRFLHQVLYKRCKIQGVLARDYSHRMDEMISQMSTWIESGQLTYKETIIKGFDQLPSALSQMLEGKNIGKMLVEV